MGSVPAIYVLMGAVLSGIVVKLIDVLLKMRQVKEKEHERAIEGNVLIRKTRLDEDQDWAQRAWQRMEKLEQELKEEVTRCNRLELEKERLKDDLEDLRLKYETLEERLRQLESGTS